MKTDLSMTNESFSFLKNSSDFLNIVLNNINSCVLVLDKEMRLRVFNDSIKQFFLAEKMKIYYALGVVKQLDALIK